MRRRVKNRAKLKNEEIISIAHKYIMQNEKQADIAKEFRISVPRVSSVVQKVLKNKNVLSEIKSLQDRKEE